MGEGAILNLVDAHPDYSQREIHGADCVRLGRLCAPSSGGDSKRMMSISLTRVKCSRPPTAIMTAMYMLGVSAQKVEVFKKGSRADFLHVALCGRCAFSPVAAMRDARRRPSAAGRQTTETHRVGQ